MLIVLELLIVAVIGAAIETITLKKIESKELTYLIAYIVAMISSVCIFFIFKINVKKGE